jgi:hypothetical protein
MSDQQRQSQQVTQREPFRRARVAESFRRAADLFENLAKGAAEARNDVTQVQAIVVGNQSRRHFRRAKYATCILLKAAARSRHRRKVFPRHGGRPEEGVIVGAADRLDPAVLVEPGRVL